MKRGQAKVGEGGNLNYLSRTWGAMSDLRKSAKKRGGLHWVPNGGGRGANKKGVQEGRGGRTGFRHRIRLKEEFLARWKGGRSIYDKASRGKVTLGRKTNEEIEKDSWIAVNQCAHSRH